MFTFTVPQEWDDIVEMEDWRRDKARRQRLEARDPNLPVVDVSFFAGLEQLAYAVSNLVRREGQQRFPGSTIPADIAVTVKHLIYTFNLLRYINADEKRDCDPDYRQAYSFVVLPVMRTMIDGFYNVTTFLNDPATGNTFRLSGYFRMKEALDEEKLRYGSDPRWTEWLNAKDKELSEGLHADGFTIADLANKPKWPLLGSYLGTEPRHTPHKNLLRTFTLGNWRAYSEISHASFRGLKELFLYLNRDSAPHDLREKIVDDGERMIAVHLARAAGLLLALVTEVQAAFKFAGHNVNHRLHAMWRNVQPFPESKELYEYRYKRLMEQSGIVDVLSDPP